MQVMSGQPLEFLEEFCHQRFDLRSGENGEEQKLVAAELPALWPNLIDILHLEKTNFLPDDVGAIILKLIWI